ncbi:MAG: AMMECR1 domain-containing protein [Candidatus Aenigmarchaeota archaeon ex4484_56]|nr:MAG: AMMECR1 domain-containing protein [Candidatus Aenigmarchaeota archaeon ex4484_56]
MFKLSLEEGRYLVKFARSSIKFFLKNLIPPKAPIKSPYPNLNEKRGVFCTLYTYPKMMLRGCIGVVMPDKFLIESVIDAGCSATQDPRFLPLKLEELDKIIIELTILSELQKISVTEPRDYLDKINIGQDGLCIKYKYNFAIFLPQVPVSQKWDVKEYLSELCKKAGLLEDSWITKHVKIYKFQAQIFSESEPDGIVYEKKL